MAEKAKREPPPSSGRRAASHGPPSGLDFEELVEDLPLMVAYWDHDRHSGEALLRYANRAFRDFYGGELEELVGRSATEIVGAEITPYLQRIKRYAREAVPLEFERIAKRRDGRSRNLWIKHFPLHVGPDAIEIFGVSIDVTSLRSAEERIAKNEQELRLAFELPSQGRAILDAGGVIKRANPALCELLGVPEDELAGAPLANFVLGPDPSRDRSPVAEALGRHVGGELGDCVIVHRDGSRRWVSVSLALADEPGLDFGVATLRDISDAKATELQLRAAARSLSEAEELAGIGSWEEVLATGEVKWSTGLYKLLGYTPGDLDDQLRTVIDRAVHKEDRANARSAMREAVRSRRPADFEFRAVRSDGRLREMRTHIEVIVDEDGQPARLVGIVRDLARSPAPAAGADAGGAIAPDRLTEDARYLLTPRQVEVLRLVAHGRSNRDVAQELFISAGTVKWHVKEILAKTGSSTRAEAVAKVLGEEI